MSKFLATLYNFRQLFIRAGLEAVQKLWQSYGTADGDAMANRSKGNVIEKESKDTSNTNTSEQALSTSNSLRTVPATSRQHGTPHFNDTLSRTIPHVFDTGE